MLKTSVRMSQYDAEKVVSLYVGVHLYGTK